MAAEYSQTPKGDKTHSYSAIRPSASSAAHKAAVTIAEVTPKHKNASLHNAEKLLSFSALVAASDIISEESKQTNTVNSVSELSP